MLNNKKQDLAFSGKYNADHAEQYFEKHNNGFWRRLSNWREHQVARKALKVAGDPQRVLDMPCGTGRFWSLLAEDMKREFHVVDYSQDMIDIGLKLRPQSVTGRIASATQGSAFSLELADNAVDNVFCIRLLHHIGERADRLKILSELHRVSASTAIVSLWVDGNFKSWKRQRMEAKRPARQYQNRFVISASSIEQEIASAGFKIKHKIDFLPLLSMWRTYILEKDKS
jgi:SAM-dependent methyltransferase